MGPHAWSECESGAEQSRMSKLLADLEEETCTVEQAWERWQSSRDEGEAPWSASAQCVREQGGRWGIFL